jgi:hypothetical protein
LVADHGRERPDATSEAMSTATAPQPAAIEARDVQSTGKKVGAPSGVAFFGTPVLLTSREINASRYW